MYGGTRIAVGGVRTATREEYVVNPLIAHTMDSRVLGHVSYTPKALSGMCTVVVAPRVWYLSEWTGGSLASVLGATFSGMLSGGHSHISPFAPPCGASPPPPPPPPPASA